MIGTGWWAFLGTFYLAYLTYQDYAQNMKVDDRKNWYMVGLTTSLYFILGRSLSILLVLLVMVELSVFIMNRYTLLGEGDVSALRWIWYGFGLLGFDHLLIFIGIFAFIITIIFITKKWVFHYKGKTPFFAQILIMFILTALITGAYK